MDYLIFGYKGSSRELKKIIMVILKSGMADKVKKLNYVQNFCLNDKTIEKTEEKIVLIHTNDYNKLSNFLFKNFPQMYKIKID